MRPADAAADVEKMDETGRREANFYLRTNSANANTECINVARDGAVHTNETSEKARPETSFSLTLLRTVRASPKAG